MTEGSQVDRAGFDARLDKAGEALDAIRPRLERLAGERRVLVYSFGVRGRDLALQLRDVGVECLVFDNAPAAVRRAGDAGFQTTAVLDPGLPVIVAAGQNQVEILAELAGRPAVYSLAEALYAYDIRNSYAPARRFTAATAEMREALFDLYQRLEPGSRAAFLEVLLYRASLDVARVGRRLPVSEMWRPPVALGIRSFCDVGAYDGDTLKAMKAFAPGLERSFTVEPNPDLDPVIARTAAGLGLTNINFVGAAWSGKARLGFQLLPSGMFEIGEAEDGDLAADALDALTAGEAYDYVKFDVEGSEARALDGAEALLRRARCIAVALYHLPNDLIDLPRRLEAILGPDGGWRLHFRHYSQSFDDSILYACR